MWIILEQQGYVCMPLADGILLINQNIKTNES